MFEPVWQQLAAASAAVAHAPLWQLSDADLVDALRAEQVAEAQRVAGRLALLRELDVRGYAGGLSFTSTQAWRSGLPGTTAVGRRAPHQALGRRRPDLPGQPRAALRAPPRRHPPHRLDRHRRARATRLQGAA
jgi:hypothetical protein